MFIKTLASQLGLALNITLEKDQNSRLVINEHQIMFFDVNSHLEDKAICKFTSRLIGRKLLEHELMAKLVGSRTAIDGVFSLLGQTTTIQSVLDECVESPFQPDNVITAEKEILLKCINQKYEISRKKRSTFLEYIFSNGAEVDRIRWLS